MEQTIFNTHDIVLLTTIYQCLLFALLIAFIGRNRRQSDYFLILLLLVHAGIPLHQLVTYGEAFRFIALEFWPGTFHLFEPVVWIEGPLLYWYTRSMVYKNHRFGRRDFYFLIPFLGYCLYLIATFYGLSRAQQIEHIGNFPGSPGANLHYDLGHLANLLRIVFSAACLIEIHRCQRKLRDWYSNVEEGDLQWLKALVGTFLALNLCSGIMSIAALLNTSYGSAFNLDLLGLSINYFSFILVSALIFFNLKFSSSFSGVDPRISLLDKKGSEPEVDPQHVSKLERHITEEKPYLANILTLEQLADQLEMTPRTLSNVINRTFHKNFFEFINQFRIEEAKRQLQDPALAKKPVTEVMLDSGFNSKASFNTFFKKLEGCTPSQYRAQQLAPSKQSAIPSARLPS